MKHSRCLVFSPYASWNYHTQIELTIARALALRGAEVWVLTCDGLFPVCDVHRRNLNPRKPGSCNVCQAESAIAMAEHGVRYHWLSRFVPVNVAREIEAWAAALRDDELAQACWRNAAIGEWALSSALYQERRARPDFADAEFTASFRRQLVSTALAFAGASGAFDELQPDLLFTLNGRFFAHRAAIEVARARGVRFVTHERGFLKDTLYLHDRELKHELEGDRRLWTLLRERALDDREIDFVERVLHERRFGKGMSWSVRYSPPPEEEAGLRAKLSLDDRPIVALFTSSEDEQATFPDWSAGAFQDGRDWLDATVEIARATPSHQFVIRMHPALVSMGSAVAALEHSAKLAERLPENCRIVAPKDDVSSYTLADAAEVVVVYYTTMGLEVAARGKQVLCVAAGWYGHAGFARFVARPSEYASALRDALGRPADVEIARRALRFAHAVFARWSIAFDLVVEEPMHRGKRNFRTSSELNPGRHDTLDRICAFLLDGAELFPIEAAGDTDARHAIETARIEASLGIADASADPTSRILDAEAAFTDGRADLACELLMLALDPNSPTLDMAWTSRAWRDLAAILHATGHSEDAAAALEQALSVDPNDQAAREDLAVLRGD